MKPVGIPLDVEVARLLKAAAVPVHDVRRLRWLSAKRKQPLAVTLQHALWSYLLPIAPDADAELRK